MAAKLTWTIIERIMVNVQRVTTSVIFQLKLNALNWLLTQLAGNLSEVNLHRVSQAGRVFVYPIRVSVGFQLFRILECGRTRFFYVPTGDETAISTWSSKPLEGLIICWCHSEGNTFVRAPSAIDTARKNTLKLVKRQVWKSYFIVLK